MTIYVKGEETNRRFHK